MTPSHDPLIVDVALQHRIILSTAITVDVLHGARDEIMYALLAWMAARHEAIVQDARLQATSTV